MPSERELVVFEKLPCLNWQEGRTEGPCIWDLEGPSAKCSGECQGDGSRLVKVGTLRQPTEDGCTLWLLNDVTEVDNPTIPDWCTDNGWTDEKRGDKRLYVIEEAPDAE